MKQIVVWDPTGEHPDGDIVDGNRVNVLVARKAVLLPVDPDLLKHHGAGGWVKRAWGKGVAYDALATRHGCPMVMHAERDRTTVHWCARVAPEPSGQPLGRIRLAVGSGQVDTIAAGIRSDESPIIVEKLGETDKWGGWTVGGKVRFTSHLSGFVGFSLYGTLGSCRVLWAAVSQTK